MRKTHCSASRATRHAASACLLVLATAACAAAAQPPDTAQITANECAARLRLCAIVDAQWDHFYDNYTFATEFIQLTEADPPYLTPRDWSAPVEGYAFALGGNYLNFTATASPATFSVDGNTAYFADVTGVLRHETGAAATAASPVLPQQCAADPADYAAGALARMCALVRAQALHHEFNGVYADSFDDFTAAYPISSTLLGDWSGGWPYYTFTLAVDGAIFTVQAQPQEAPDTSPWYYADESGVIRQRRGAAAGPEDAPVQTACPAHPPLLNRLIPFMAENEARTRRRMCQIFEAEQAYFADKGVYAVDFHALTETEPPYLTPVDWSAAHDGYNFLLGGSLDGFTATGSAFCYGLTGLNGYFIDSTGVLCAEYTADAWQYSPPSIHPCGEGGEGEGAPADTHTADQDGDGQFSISELLRVVQFVNSDAYHCSLVTKDGFAPGPSHGWQNCAPHSSDYHPQDWRVSLSELLRLVQFYNLGGGYTACPSSEDGFCVAVR